MDWKQYFGKDKVLFGLGRIAASLAAGYALIATMTGGDPTAASGDIAQAKDVIAQTIDFIYRAGEHWELVVAAVLPLVSKFNLLIPKKNTEQ